MEKLFTIRLELTCKDVVGNLYTTSMNYCSPNQYTSLIAVVSEFQFAMAATKACENAGFPYGCYLVGIRDIDDIDKDSE